MGEMTLYGTLVIFLLISGSNSCLRNVQQIECQGEHCERLPPANVPWQCGVCGVPVDVTLRVRNAIVEPKFDHTEVLKSVNTQELFYLLLRAANNNGDFRFSMSYWGATLGMMVDKINGLAGDWSQKRYWQILFANGTQLDVGISSYVPQDKDEIVFEYSVYKQGDQK